MGTLKWKKGMGPLDLSSLTDLIEDFEGNIQPESEPYFKATKLADGVWSVLSNGDYTYVLEGDDELLCIDSGMGAGSIRDFCQSLCPEKPLYRIINTHNHFDHTLNNYQFDVVYMSEWCYEGRCRKMGDFKDIDVPDDYPVVFLKDGDVFNLKGRPLEVYAIAEHCAGSLSFLDRKSRILFCGDELNDHFFDSRISVEHSYRNLKRWASFRDAYDLLCAGNGQAEARFVDQYLEMAEDLLFKDPDLGKEYYEPYEDRIATVTELDGKPVYSRRSPKFAKMKQAFIDAGLGRYLEYSHGRMTFCFGRKLGKDGPFDRQYEKGDARFCYYRNRIWDK